MRQPTRFTLEKATELGRLMAREAADIRDLVQTLGLKQ
jgi:hypothetical protein